MKVIYLTAGLTIFLMLIAILTPVRATIVNNTTWRTINYDYGFDNPESYWCTALGCPWSMTLDNFSYWVPSVHGGCGQINGKTYINSSILHTRQNGTISTNSCWDNSIAQQGNFPWMKTQRGCLGTSQKYQPQFFCPRNSFGLREAGQSDFPLNVSTFAIFNSRNTPTQNAYYSPIIDLYWWFDRGNVTSQGHTYRWMETIIRLASASYSIACSCWTDDPIGTSMKSTSSDNNFVYAEVVWNMQPGRGLVLSALNGTAIFQHALTAWGIPSDTHAVILGVEVGTEGYASILSFDFNDMRIGSRMPDVAAADVNFDHVINILDVSQVGLDFDLCPHNHGGSKSYYWTADVASQIPPDIVPPNQTGTDSCINQVDVSTVSYYWQMTY